MNTAARLLNQGALSRGWVISVMLTKNQAIVIATLLAVLISALSIVFVTNTTRTINASIQQTLAERDRLHIEWGQLLLEKSTWTMQARVQQTAENQLGMVVPDSKSVVIINE